MEISSHTHTSGGFRNCICAREITLFRPNCEGFEPDVHARASGKKTSFIQSVCKSLSLSSEPREAYYLWDGDMETSGISYNFHKSPYLRLIFTQPNIWPLGLRNPKISAV